MSQQGKSILESILGSLLGFDDGASDVLEHLLTIESKDDLIEYLSQLLGNESPELISFVDNVGRYKRGEEVILLVPPGTNNSDDKEDSKPKAKDTAVKTQQPNGRVNKNRKSNKNDALQGRRNQKQSKGRLPPPPKKAVAAAAAASRSTNNNTTVQQSQPNQPQNKEIESKPTIANGEKPNESVKPVQKSRPKRGEAKIVCGCYGTKHKVLTNCLYCGRISCTQEGYDFCPFCGWMIEEIKDESNGNDKSWVQKERLLRFDREFARRTQIFDDQADFQAPTTTWMSDQERMDAEEVSENNRIEAMNRPKQTLSLSIE